jgi:hypothetical protein
VSGDVVHGDLRSLCTTSLGILIFKGLTVRHLYKSFGVKGLIRILKRKHILMFVESCLDMKHRVNIALRFVSLHFDVCKIIFK